VILVVGGTGRLGSLVVGRLTARGLPVRVMTRDPARAAKVTSELIQVVQGDVRDRSSVVRAVDGATVVVSAMHGFPGTRHADPASIDRDGNLTLADVARTAGADLVLMSVVGASAAHPMELFRMKYAAEAHASALGLPLTILRATAYLELWIDILRQTAHRSGRPVVFGRGVNPINFVSVVDVASIVDRAVTDTSVRGRTLEISGPASLTMNELAAAVQTADRRTKAPRHLPRAALAVAANTAGRARPAVGRQLRAALTMDKLDLSTGPSPLPEGYARPETTAAMCLSATSAPGHDENRSASMEAK
jgi:uncharacterized protein YbjT (DUF2867 family)